MLSFKKVKTQKNYNDKKYLKKKYILYIYFVLF